MKFFSSWDLAFREYATLHLCNIICGVYCYIQLSLNKFDKHMR